MLKEFVIQLRHRRVLRTAIAYAILVAAAVEFTDIVSPVLDLPAGLLQAVIVLGLAGFPLVLVLSWFFDFTTDGIVRGTSTPAPTGSGKAQMVSIALIVLLGGAVIYLGQRLYQEQDQPMDFAHGKSIAVLPFSSISEESASETAYFSDGIAEEILTALSRVDGLRVAARTSSFALRDAGINDIGEMLDVSLVLEGTVRRAGDQLRVSAQLIDTANGFQLWSEVYDHQLEDVFQIQEDISHSIVNALSLEVLGDGRRLVTPGTKSTQAYDKYLEGRSLLQTHTPAAAQRAVEIFNEALLLDPEYAQAYTGLADSWIVLREVGNLSLSEATQHSHAAITRALQLNPDLPEAQASLGLCILGGGDKSSAGLQFQKAIELDPEYANAYLLRANLLRDQGYLDQANRVYTQALALDPFNPTVIENTALLLGYQGRFEEAASQVTAALEKTPGRTNLLLTGSRIAALAGDNEVAHDLASRAVELTPQSPLALALLVDANLRLGQLEEARTVLQKAQELASQNETVNLATMRFYHQSGDSAALAAITSARVDPILGNPGWANTEFLFQGITWAGISRLSLGDSLGAEELLEAGITDPGRLDPRPDAAYTLSLLARARYLNGDVAGAESMAASARQLLDRAEAEGWAAQLLHYQHALAAAAIGAGDEALEQLRTAIGLGWNDFMDARNNPVLADVIRLPAYEALAQNASAD